MLSSCKCVSSIKNLTGVGCLEHNENLDMVEQRRNKVPFGQTVMEGGTRRTSSWWNGTDASFFFYLQVLKYILSKQNSSYKTHRENGEKNWRKMYEENNTERENFRKCQYSCWKWELSRFASNGTNLSDKPSVSTCVRVCMCALVSDGMSRKKRWCSRNSECSICNECGHLVIDSIKTAKNCLMLTRNKITPLIL
jgi:hypothetical protein